MRLKESVEALGGATLAVTLAAVMLALFPAVAEARTEDNGTSLVVVRPGDSLWSISEDRLGPNATPQQIENGVGQIYALNGERIGPDPNVIFVGQELLLPPAMSGRHAGAKPALKTTGAAGAGTRDPATSNTADKAPKTASGGASVRGGEAREPAPAPVAEPAALPPLPDVGVAAPVPAVGSPAPSDSPASPAASFLRTVRTGVAAASALAVSLFEVYAEGRRLLGLGVLVLTLLVAAVMAWKLPMRRTTRGDAERWRTSPGYYGAPAASGVDLFAYHPGSLGDRDKQDTRREAPGHGRRAALIESGDASAPGRVRRADTAGGRVPKARAVPRNALALGAHNPKVRRAPRLAHATMRARKLRPRRRASRRPRPPVVAEQTGRTRDGY